MPPRYTDRSRQARRATLHADDPGSIGPDRQPQAAVAEDPARARRDNGEDERPAYVQRRTDRQHYLQHQLAGGGLPAYRAEPGTVVQQQGCRIVGRHKQADAAAPRDVLQMRHYRRHGLAAEAAALLPRIDREPAQPPACRVARVGVDDVEADQQRRGLDGHHGMRRAVPDGVLNLGDGAEKVLDLGRVEHNRLHGAKFGAAEAAVGEGRIAPNGRHDSARANDKGTPLRASTGETGVLCR